MAKIFKWQSVAESKFSTIEHSGRLGSLGANYRFFLHPSRKELTPAYVPEDGDEIHAIPRPQGVEAAIAVAVVTTIITAALLPEPEVPQAAGKSKTSPNNQPSSQSNTSRLGQGKPEIRGVVKAFPDLIQAPWYYYTQNTQKILQKFLVGKGDFGTNASNTEINIGETSFDNIAGADYFWNGDGDLGNGASELGLYHSFYPARNESVEKIVIKDENQSAARIDYFESDASANTIAVNGFVAPLFPDLTGITPLIGDALELEGTKSFSVYEVSGGPSITEDGYFEYDTYTVETRDINSDPVSSSTVFVFHVTNRTISTNQEIQYNSGDLQARLTRGDEGVDGWSVWQYIKPLRYAMLNLSWPSSIVDSSGDPASMDWEIQYENNSGIQTITGTKEAFDNSPVYHSELLNVTAAATVSRFRVRRTTSYADAPSDMTVDSCFSLGVYSPTTISGNGILSTTYRGGKYSTNQISGDVSIISIPAYYFYTAGSVTYNSAPTSQSTSFADSVLTDLVAVYGSNTDDIKAIADIDELYDIESSISGNLGSFSYTFDDLDIDLESRIQTACNCARVTAYKENGKWRFTRDESKPVSAIFNRRNIAGSSDNEQSISFQKPLDKDGVALKYIDPDTFKEAYIYRSISGGSITTSEPSRPMEIDLAGCSNVTQATNRADLEVRKMVYQRRRVKERVLIDGLNVDVGDRVKWASIYDSDVYHGEILEITDNDTVTVSETVSGAILVHYIDTSGDVVGPITCTGSGTTLTRSSGPNFSDAYVADTDIQAGSYFIAGTTENLEYTDMTVISKEAREDGTVDLEMIEYNELIYSED